MEPGPAQGLLESEKEMRVKKIIEKLQSFTVRAFTELLKKKADEAVTKKRLLMTIEGTFKELWAVLGKSGLCSHNMGEILVSSPNIPDLGEGLEKVYAASTTFLLDVRVLLVGYFEKNEKVTTISDFCNKAIDSAIRELNREVSIDSDPTGVFKIPEN
jgi:hypothetical protein